MTTEQKARVREIGQIALGGILANPRFYDWAMEQQTIPGRGGFADIAATLATEYAIALTLREDKIL